MTEPKDPHLQAHPFAKQARPLWLLSLALVACGLVSAAAGNVVFAIVFVGVGGFLAFRAHRLPVAMQVVQTVNQSLAHQLAGRYADAERLLTATEPLARGRYLQRVFPAHRAQMALDQGDLEAAERHATLALALPPRPWTRSAERVHMVGAQAIRALARALSGNETGALEDASAVEAYDEASAANLGRVLLARLAVSARAGDHERLRELCRLGATMPAIADLRPRERAMLRSYRKLAFAPGAGAYREGSNPDAGADVSPEAELFRGSDAQAPAEPARAPLSPEQRAELERLSHERKDAGIRQKRTLRRRGIGVGVALGLALLVPLFALSPSTHRTPRRARHAQVEVERPTIVWNAVGMVGALAVLVVGGMIVFNRRESRIVLRAHKAHALGDTAALEPLVERMRKSRLSVVRAQGHLLAAARAFAAADFETALARADEANLAVASEQLRALHADLLVPLISSQRAVALAALGRTDAARVEHAALLQACPTFAYRGSVAHRVDLLSAVSTGAWAEARALAAERPDGAPIPIREEMLGDLARMEEAASDVERRRIRDELAENPALSHWIATVAPGLIERATASLRA